MSQTLILIGFLLLVFCLQLFFFIKRYIKVPPNKMMVIYGKVSQDPTEKYQVHSSGSHFVWPVIQEHVFLDITPGNLTVEAKAQDINQEPMFCRLLLDYKISSEVQGATKYIELNGVGNDENLRKIIQNKVGRVLKTVLLEQEKSKILANPMSLENSLIEKLKVELAEMGLVLIDVGELSVR